MIDLPGLASPLSPHACVRVCTSLKSDVGAGTRELPPASLFF
jgi:hypothetical protein